MDRTALPPKYFKATQLESHKGKTAGDPFYWIASYVSVCGVLYLAFHLRT
jgi:hypothetical protein